MSAGWRNSDSRPIRLVNQPGVSISLCRIHRAVLAKEIDVIPVEFERLQAECAIAYRSVLKAAAAWIAGDDDPSIRFLEAIRPLGITVVDGLLRDELADRRRAKAEADEQVRRASWAFVSPYEPASVHRSGDSEVVA